MNISKICILKFAPLTTPIMHMKEMFNLYMGKHYFWRKTQNPYVHNIFKIGRQTILRKKGLHWLGQGTQISINEN